MTSIKENKKFLKKLFDQIYVINLDTEKGREKKKYILENIYFNDLITFFQGFNGSIEDPQYFIKKNYISKYFITEGGKKIEPKKGENGINITTKLICEDILKNDYKNVLIMEDDAVILDNNFAGIIIDVFRYLPFDWEIFLLGYHFDINDIEQKIEFDSKFGLSILKLKKYMLQHCYVINRKTALKILTIPINSVIEMYYSKYFKVYTHSYYRRCNKYFKRSNNHYISKLVNQKDRINSEIDEFGGHSINMIMVDDKIYTRKEYIDLINSKNYIKERRNKNNIKRNINLISSFTCILIVLYLIRSSKLFKKKKMNETKKWRIEN